MSFYLDASVILPILIEEPGSVAVDAFRQRADAPLIVSEFAAAEVASALSRLVRMGVFSDVDAQSRLADFDAWRAADTADEEVQASDIRLTSAYVRRFDLMLRAPDAMHTAICRRASHVLVTLDKRLAAAANELGVVVRLLG